MKQRISGMVWHTKQKQVQRCQNMVLQGQDDCRFFLNTAAWQSINDLSPAG